MGCGSSTGSDGKIRMQKTKLPGMDEVFDEVQGFVDEVYEIQDPIDDALENLLWYTNFHKTVGATAHHCCVGIVFSLAAASNGAGVDNLFEVKPASPFLELNKSSAQGDTVKAIDAFTDYIKALTAAKDRIEPLAEKAKGFAEKAPDLPGKCKEDISNSKDLGMMEKAKAAKNTATNSKHMAKLPSLVTGLKDTIQEAFESIQGAGKELTAKKDKLSDIGKDCAAKKLEYPKDCYLECGDPINVDGNAKKRHAAQQKKMKKKNAGQKKGEDKKKDTSK